jgi:cytochrome c-type biogenesis protein CcmF
MFPHRNMYLLRNQPAQPATEVAIQTGPTRDLYVVLTSLVNGRATLSVFVNPLVMWLWVAGIIVALGALVAAWPAPRSARQPARAPAGGERRVEA